MRFKIIASVFVIVVLVIALFALDIINFSIIDSGRESEHRIILKKIEEIGNLELVKYNFDEVVEEKIARSFMNYDNLAPDSRALVLINGEAVGCINLKMVTGKDITADNDTIFITLPQPEICYAKVNHDKSRVYDINYTARLLNPELIDKAFKNAELKIKEAAVKEGILEKTKENGRKFIAALIKTTANKEIVVEFK
ncbi:MAG TPA: DUF4230 domain-containing protein [Ignavibacteriales bacterium]|nr:DUF4230 domain-containing protein [Ignavibacteriales bacterium]